MNPEDTPTTTEPEDLDAVIMESENAGETEDAEAIGQALSEYGMEVAI